MAMRLAANQMLLQRASVRKIDKFCVIFVIVSTFSMEFHRCFVNVLSRSWSSSIIRLVIDDIAMICEQRHLKSTLFFLWDAAYSRRQLLLGRSRNSLRVKSCP